MQDEIILQRFQKFKAMMISSNIPNSLLMEMIESYITSDDELPVEEIYAFDGQLSLFDGII